MTERTTANTVCQKAMLEDCTFPDCGCPTESQRQPTPGVYETMEQELRAAVESGVVHVRPKVENADRLSVARKDDESKAPLHLIDPLWAHATAQVLDFGQRKYKAWNWAKGTFNWSQLYRAAQAHLTAWWDGEDKDPETGLPHLWHANCCLMFLTRYTWEGWGNDDRPVWPHSDIVTRTTRGYRHEQSATPARPSAP